MISVLFPTRCRAALLTRTVNSIRATAASDVEVCVYIDKDDTESVPAAEKLGIKYMVGPRITLSDCWNKCLSLATGDIYMQGNDDLIFRTLCWDVTVQNFYDESSDKIWFLHGSDGQENSSYFGTAGFVHKRWVDTVGYFIVPLFSSDYGDTWLNDVANLIGRRAYAPFLVEHMHFFFGKAPIDATYSERLTRHKRDGVDALYKKTANLRAADAAKLKAVMEGT